MSGKPNPSKSGDIDLDYSLDKSIRRFASQDLESDFKKPVLNLKKAMRTSWIHLGTMQHLLRLGEPLPNSKRRRQLIHTIVLGYICMYIYTMCLCVHVLDRVHVRSNAFQCNVATNVIGIFCHMSD